MRRTFRSIRGEMVRRSFSVAVVKYVLTPEGGGRSLPVLELLSDSLGEPAAEQPHHEEQRHTGTDHGQDVVLGRRCHHLHGQVPKSLSRRHLVDGREKDN